MSLDGVRAWIAEVEHKLRMRTRVFLVLTAIAIGGAGTAIYLAIDTRDNTVSKSDVEALERTGDTGSEVAALEAELQALQAQIQTLQSSEEKPPEESGGAAVPKTQQEPVKPQKEPPEETGKPQETKKAG